MVCLSSYRSRTRTLSFRLSEAEYADLQNHCLEQGGRSISAFTRLALRRALGETWVLIHGVEDRVRELEQQAESIERQVTRLLQEMAQP